jgi:His-Xaa-Ser repeat protein HxsA
MHHPFRSKVIGLVTGFLALLGSGKDVGAALAAQMAPSDTAQPSLDAKPLLFIDADSPDAADYLLAAHRSHSSHRSHKSHYSSRGGGGGYSRSAPVYTPPAISVPKSVTPSNPSTRSTPAATGAAVTHQMNLIKNIQEGLIRLGYAPGAADGQLGKETKKAIAMFQADQGLTINGELSQSLLVEIQNEIKTR